jgi:hypothetical protein
MLFKKTFHMATISALTELIGKNVKSTFVSEEDAAIESSSNDALFSTKNILHFLNLLMTFVAFFLAFKCIQKGGNAVAHILGACCCGVVYIAYALANGCHA